MKKKFTAKILIFTVLICCGFISCNNVDLVNFNKDIALEASMGMPIGYAEATVREIVENAQPAEITINGDTVVWSITRDTVYKMRQIKPQSFEWSVVTPVDIIAGSGEFTTPVPINSEIKFFDGTTDERIDSAYINSLPMNITLSSSVLSAISSAQVKLTFDPSKVRYKNGGEIIKILTFTPSQPTQPLDLQNIKVVDLGSDATIGIPVKVEITVAAQSSTIIPAGSSIAFHATFETFDYEIAYGSFKPADNLININEIFDFEIDRDQYLAFLNPSVEIKVKSTAGVKMGFYVNYLKALRINPDGTQDNSFVEQYAEFQNGAHNDSMIVEGPLVKGQTPEQFTKLFDKDHGKTDRLFAQETMPNRIEYQYSVRIIPERNLIPGSNKKAPMFITPDAEIRIYAKAKIPFWLGEKSRYNYKDSVDNVCDSVFSQLKKLEENGLEINSMALRLKIKNHLPIHAKLNMKFLKTNGEDLSNNFPTVREVDIPMPPVDENGSVISYEEKIIEIPVPEESINLLKNEVKVITFDMLFDSDQKNKMYAHPDDYFRVDIGLQVNGVYKTTLGKKGDK